MCYTHKVSPRVLASATDLLPMVSFITTKWREFVDAAYTRSSTTSLESGAIHGGDAISRSAGRASTQLASFVTSFALVIAAKIGVHRRFPHLSGCYQRHSLTPFPTPSVNGGAPTLADPAPDASGALLVSQLLSVAANIQALGASVVSLASSCTPPPMSTAEAAAAATATCVGDGTWRLVCVCVCVCVCVFVCVCVCVCVWCARCVMCVEAPMFRGVGIVLAGSCGHVGGCVGDWVRV